MFWWLDIPAAWFWAIVMGLLSIIPLLGPPIVWGPAALMSAGWPKCASRAGDAGVLIPPLDTAPALLVAAPLLLICAGLLAAPLFGVDRPATRAGVVAGVAVPVAA